MSRGNKYALIAKDNNSTDYKFISFDDEKITKLEKIDLYTMYFENKDALVNQLFDNGQIKDTNVDLFIVCSKKNGKEITFMEPLYYGTNYLLIRHLLDTIPQFLKKNVDNKKCFDQILRQFESKIINNSNFYDMVIWNKTNLYGKFCDYIKQSRKMPGFMEKIKHNDGGWIYDSYPLIRNMVEAINRYDNISKQTRDVFNKNNEIYYENKKNREKIIPSLKEKFEDGYIVGQISLFDMFGDNVGIVEAPKTAEIIEPPKEAKITRINWKKECELYSDIDIATKLSEVREVLWKLPRNVFKSIKVNNGRNIMVFNENIFENYDNERNKQILKNALKSSFMNIVNMYSIKKEDYENALRNCCNTNQVQDDMRFFAGCIINELKKDKNNYENLNRAYIWCKTYVECRDKDIEYRNNNSNDKGFSK